MRRRLVLAEDDVEDEEAFLDADVDMVGVAVSLCCFCVSVLYSMCPQNTKVFFLRRQTKRKEMKADHFSLSESKTSNGTQENQFLSNP